MKKFFSEENQVNLSNIDDETSVNYILNISFTVTSEQIEQAIYRLLNDKTLELNNILNKIFKKVTHCYSQTVNSQIYFKKYTDRVYV